MILKLLSLPLNKIKNTIKKKHKDNKKKIP